MLRYPHKDPYYRLSLLYIYIFTLLRRVEWCIITPVRDKNMYKTWSDIPLAVAGEIT